ncbi:MAG: hypothetical protein N4Q25_09900 [Lactobacillus crispatus]|nr:hypothetical protein [Lactobacillus crispatus]MCT7860926.1 hypothetical protein [Lactobacillus crispatus]
MYVDWKLEHLNAQYSNAELQFFLIVSVTVVLIALGLVANYLIRKQINNPQAELTESRSKKLVLESRLLQGYIALALAMTVTSCYFLVNYGSIAQKVINYIAQR